MVVLRLFLAVDPGDEARFAIVDLLRSRIKEMPGRAVPPQHWHVTLRFLGGVGEAGRDKVTYAVDGAELGSAFSVRWGGLGAFPKASKAAVLWVGADHGGDRLVELAKDLGQAVEDAGFGPEDRPFRPHLTLSRIRPPEDVSDVIEGVEAMGVTSKIDAVLLYRSHLGGSGARYELLERFPLR